MDTLWPDDYEKVFGKPTKWSLFSEDEEAYEAFRQTIIDAPNYVYDKGKLPFTSVKVYNYDLYLLKLYIDKHKATGKELFYIKDETPGLANVLAFGYFNTKSHSFCLMAYSLIRKTEFQDKMKKIKALYWPVIKLKSNSEIRKCETEEQQDLQLELFRPEGYRLTQDVECSASLAAAYALGQEADFTKWKSMKGKTLAQVYNFYNNTSEQNEIQSIWRCLRSLKVENTPIIELVDDNHLLADKIIIPLLRHKGKEANTHKTPTKALEIEAPKEKPVAKKAKASTQRKADDTPVETPTRRAPKTSELSVIRCYLVDLLTGKYKATGLYSVQEKTIKVLAGAIFSTDVSSAFRYSAADYQRRTFIKYHCSTRNSKYTLREDCLFNTVDIAATFIMGKIVNGYSEWKSENGKTIGEMVE
jgi:hypothetical protein